jgi:hypothetical protein
MEQTIENLLAIGIEQRDESWERALMAVLPTAKGRVVSGEPIEGPDGWPYLLVETDNEADDILLNIISWLSSRGIGLVLNPNKELPDLVLSWGMVWNFKERGEFLTASSEQGSQISTNKRFEIKDGQKLWAGPPSEAFLPSYVRKIVKQFFMDQGIMVPKVQMVSADRINFDLCFSIESLKSPPAHEHANIVEAIAWFLPMHYSVSLLSESVVPGFSSL